MLQSMGSQRVGHGLVTEQRKQQGENTRKRRVLKTEPTGSQSLETGKTENKRTRWFLDSKTERNPCEFHFSFPPKMGYCVEKQMLQDTCDSCKLYKTSPREHPASASSLQELSAQGVGVHAPHTHKDLTAQMWGQTSLGTLFHLQPHRNENTRSLATYSKNNQAV